MAIRASDLTSFVGEFDALVGPQTNLSDFAVRPPHFGNFWKGKGVYLLWNLDRTSPILLVAFDALAGCTYRRLKVHPWLGVLKTDLRHSFVP